MLTEQTTAMQQIGHNPELYRWPQLRLIWLNYKDITTRPRASSTEFLKYLYSIWLTSVNRAGGTGPVGPAMAGPTFWRNYKIFVSTRYISGPQNFRSLLLEGFWGAEICLECVGGRGSAPDPAGGAQDAPPDHLVGWGGGHPPQEPHHPRRLDPRAFGARCSAPSVPHF